MLSDRIGFILIVALEIVLLYSFFRHGDIFDGLLGVILLSFMVVLAIVEPCEKKKSRKHHSATLP